MSLRIPVRSLLAAMLVLPMMLGVLSTSTAAARDFAPTGNGSLIITDSVAVTENVASHFGFNNQLIIGSTTVSKTASSSSLIAPGQTASFSVTITAPPITPPGNVLLSSFNFREYIGSGLTFSSITSTTPGVFVSCSPSSGGSVPSGTDPSAAQLLCSVSGVPAGTTSLTFTVNTTVDADLIFSSAQLTNTVVAPNVSFLTDPNVTNTGVSASATVGGAFPSGLVQCSNGQVAYATLNPVGSSGVSAQLTTLGHGGLGGYGGLGNLGGYNTSPFSNPFQSSTYSNSGLNSFVLQVQSTTSSVALAAQTSSGLEFPALSQSYGGYGGYGGSFNPLVQITVSPFQQPGGYPFNNYNNYHSSTTYTGTFSGTPLSGGTVYLFSGSTLVAQGTWACHFREHNIPFIPPPPPLQFIPPPPPPLLPPPPPAPMQGRGMMAEVPVIPEADSLFLLGGGLAILGGLMAARALRRRDDA